MHGTENKRTDARAFHRVDPAEHTMRAVSIIDYISLDDHKFTIPQLGGSVTRWWSTVFRQTFNAYSMRTSCFRSFPFLFPVKLSLLLCVCFIIRYIRRIHIKPASSYICRVYLLLLA